MFSLNTHMIYMTKKGENLLVDQAITAMVVPNNLLYLLTIR